MPPSRRSPSRATVQAKRDMSSARAGTTLPIRALRALACCAILAFTSVARAGAQEHEMGDAEARTVIHGFTDVTYLTGGSNTVRTSAFGLGQVDLYLTSRISDRLSFLVETVFEFDDASG